ncbi:general transcription factor 3C polypeptide 6 [Cocos nucifera]|uniref:General transcription factor 3C polypeptide 6 n=1 Tax=Cocos nucifera TaxID=13894 RepID=A0A8K0N5B6_COCNU|nr:general transcription factor 3C polypeptide 6 [Cocos nucifera]
MEGNLEENREVEGEEEYLLLDLDEVCVHGDIPANAPYVLSGLDTLNPILVIGNHLKLIGEYQETIGTCFVFSESDAVLHQEAGSSETNLLKDKCIMDSNEASFKHVKPIAKLHKVLKFKLATDDQNQITEKS